MGIYKGGLIQLNLRGLLGPGGGMCSTECHLLVYFVDKTQHSNLEIRLLSAFVPEIFHYFKSKQFFQQQLLLFNVFPMDTH